jgi:hypothetical protein
MKTIYGEAGDRPVVATKARLNTPSAAKVLCDILSDQDWADLCIITTDWIGDGRTPVMEIHTLKWSIKHGGRYIEHRWNIDIEEAFGEDNMTNPLLHQIVRDIEEKIREAEQRGPSDGPKIITN